MKSLCKQPLINNTFKHNIIKRPKKVGFLFFITILLIIVWYHWAVNYRPKELRRAEEIIKLISKNFKYTETIRRPDKLPKGTKYMLLWTPIDWYPFYDLGPGNSKFIEHNCPMNNCYVTTDRNFFGRNLTKFDAIGFNSRNIFYQNMFSRLRFPKMRSPSQIYMFFGTESSDNIPLCSGAYDGFFNWTVTYKLDSDIVWGSFHVLNEEGQVVGPNRNMKWAGMENSGSDPVVLEKIGNKTKIAAWFVSNCNSRSSRERYVKDLQSALQAYNLTIDIYGKCGTMHCPRDKHNHCKNMLEENYYFYLAFENSFSEDYVTEKPITALQHHTVPVVYGGANYTRFLPPGSYIDARAHSPSDLARLMISLYQSPKLYSQYFVWMKHYKFDHMPAHMCAMCAALNNASMVQTRKVYDNLRWWWNPDYKNRCQL